MLRLTRTAIGLLTAQYRSVLKKCWAINVGIFGLMGKAVADTIQGTLSAFGVNVTDVLSMMRSLDGMLGIQRHPDVEQRGAEGSSDAFGITSFLQNDWILRPWLRMTRKGATLPAALVAATVVLTAVPTEAMAEVTDDMVPGVEAGIFDRMHAYITQRTRYGSRYNLLTSQGNNTDSVVINGVTYYYTPKEKNDYMNDALRDLVFLSSYVSDYLKSGTSTNYDYKIDSTYNTFNNVNIPTYTNKYKVVETTASDPDGFAERQSDGTDKYYKVLNIGTSDARKYNLTADVRGGYYYGIANTGYGGALGLSGDVNLVEGVFIKNRMTGAVVKVLRFMLVLVKL